MQCIRCKRPLKDPLAIRRRMGRVCFAKLFPPSERLNELRRGRDNLRAFPSVRKRRKPRNGTPGQHALPLADIVEVVSTELL